ncbi:MAG: MFS transporter [Actinobacteria bacterium]|jgi:MFS family permease|nr:MFS transporter [Actinomycetota bacterium]MBT7013533.1 MFS transporter [Actinomycetota bacterium]
MNFLSMIKNKLGALSISLGIFAVVTTINSQTIQLTLWDRDFEKPIAILQWVNLSYLLMAAVSTLLIGRFADLIGRKRMFIYGLLIYGLSTSLLVAVNSFELLLVARGLQALGAQCVMGLSVGLMTTMFGDENRGSAVGLIASIGSVSVLFIPLTIGYLAEYNNWRLFFILPVALSFISAYILLRVNLGTETVTIDKVDVKSLVFITLILSSFSSALTFFRVENITNTISFLLLFLCPYFIWLFYKRQKSVANPIFPRGVFADKRFQISLFTIVIYFISIGGWSILSPYFFTQGLGLNSFEYGLIGTGFGLILVPMAIVAGRIYDKKGLRTSLYIGAYGNIIAGIIWLTTPYFLNIPYILLNGIFGIAPVVSSVATDAEIMSKFNLENRGTGSSMIETLHVIFAFAGTVLYSTIYDFSLEIFVGGEATYSTEMFCFITGILAIINWGILAILVKKNESQLQ